MSKNSELLKLKREYSECKRCPLLVKNRTNVVFGVGDADSCKVVIIGEAPGMKEDTFGVPFIGPSGKILNSFLEEINLSREKDVYILNTILCRPPKNRNPKSEELKNCKERLEKQLFILKPKVLITLGNFATRYILNTKEGINKLRGKSYEVRIGGFVVKVVPIQHPAVLLYNGNSSKKRKEFSDDFEIVKKIIFS